MKEKTKRDFYEVLGVPRDSSQEEIKRAYRSKALQYHPDRNPGDKEAEDLFKEASEAYEALGDPRKRELYDTYGFAGLKGTDFRPFTSFEDIFSSFGDIFGDLFGFGRVRQAWQRGADLRYQMELSFEEAALGAERTIEVDKPGICTSCGGSRAEPGTEPETCSRCQGRGQVLRNHGFLHISTPCPECSGEGVVIRKPCTECRGKGQVKTSTSLEVKIPAGIEDESVLRMRGEGMPSTGGGPPGDLLIGILVQEHKIFQRQGPELFMVLPVSFAQAALGDTVEVPTLGEPRELKVPAGTQPGTMLRVDGGGIKIGRRQGDLHARVDVRIPKKLSAEQKKILREYAASEGPLPREKKWWQI